MTDAASITNAAPVTGLILSGGGARAAYQVGVLSAIGDLLPDATHNPFPVIVGTSAGAINAVGLACGAMNFTDAIRQLTKVWQGFHTHQVYRSDWPGVVRQAARFIGHSLLGMGREIPVALLDNSPLRQLLERELDLSGIGASLARKRLRAVAVTAFGYNSDRAVTFYQGRTSIEPWSRHRRLGVPTRLKFEHLLASAAIPLIFPPVKVSDEYFGDGAVRQSAPISPALHLGATRALVIGVSGKPDYDRSDSATAGKLKERPPSLAQIGGHLLNSTFIDSLEGDIELLERINRMNLMLPVASTLGRPEFKSVEVLVVSPSQSIDQIAARHRHELPRALRFFLRGAGATKSSGGGVLSYLLFEAGYCNELIELGYQDAMNQKEKLCQFLGLDNVPVSSKILLTDPALPQQIA